MAYLNLLDKCLDVVCYDPLQGNTANNKGGK